MHGSAEDSTTAAELGPVCALSSSLFFLTLQLCGFVSVLLSVVCLLGKRLITGFCSMSGM
jgi:hypothetical protein